MIHYTIAIEYDEDLNVIGWKLLDGYWLHRLPALDGGKCNSVEEAVRLGTEAMRKVQQYDKDVEAADNLRRSASAT